MAQAVLKGLTINLDWLELRLSNMLNKIDFINAMYSLKESGQEFNTVFEHGTLSVEVYKPDRVDKQQPHERDEVYIIASGHGKFTLEHEETSIKAGDFLFVPAGANHRFIEFSGDFSTWVLFYGPQEGEKGTVRNHLS